MSGRRGMSQVPWTTPIATEPAPWMADAACAGVPVEWVDFGRSKPFGATAEERSEWDEHLAACAAICRRCPVIRDCRSFARRHALTFGVWGGVAFGTNGRHRELVAA